MAGKRDSHRGHSTTGFSENFVVTETSYQMLEVLLEVAFYYRVPSNRKCNFIFVYRCSLKGELRGNSLHKFLQNCLKIVGNCEPPLDNYMEFKLRVDFHCRVIFTCVRS